MSDNQSIENNNITEPSPQKNNTTPILLGIIAILLLVVAYFVWNRPQEQGGLTLEQAQHQSDSLYNDLKSQLTKYKNENEELYSQIAQKEAELENQYSKIKRLIDQANRDKTAKKQIEAKLLHLGEELAGLRQYAEKQATELEMLRAENLRLKQEKENLDKQYAEELAMREKLEAEGHDLENANEELQQKLNTASVLQTANAKATGFFLKNNGERKEINIAKRIEFVEICFEIVKNETCETGPNRFHLRLLDPSGAVVSDPNRGSDKLTLFDDGSEIGYTTSKIFDYTPNLTALCMEWSAFPTTPFHSGTYKVEIYNKGRLVGECSLVVK